MYMSHMAVGSVFNPYSVLAHCKVFWEEMLRGKYLHNFDIYRSIRSFQTVLAT